MAGRRAAKCRSLRNRSRKSAVALDPRFHTRFAYFFDYTDCSEVYTHGMSRAPTPFTGTVGP